MTMLNRILRILFPAYYAVVDERDAYRECLRQIVAYRAELDSTKRAS